MVRSTHLFTVVSIVALLAPVAITNTIPAQWAGTFNLGYLLLTRWGTRLHSQIALAAGAYTHIFDIIQNCRTKEGADVDPYECANSVIVSAFSMGLAVTTYQSTGTWTKRDTYNADEFLARIPQAVKITDIKILGDPIIANASSPSLRRRQLDEDDEPIHVNYNGSLPLTFVMHHEVGNDNGDIVPLFIATDGSRMQIYHVEPVNATSGHDNEGQALRTRNGFNGYNHIGTGGIKLQGNSDPVAYWDDVQDWLNRYSSHGTLYDIVAETKSSIWMGHAFSYEKAAGKYDGQFIIEGETVPFGGEWERGWNWCFGVYPTEC